MQRYFNIQKSCLDTASEPFKDKSNNKSEPYKPPKRTTPTQRTKHINYLLGKFNGQPSSSNSVSNLLLNTLSDEANPITNSDIYERSDHVISTSTGHQVANGCIPTARPSYLELRGRKLELQRQAATDDKSNILRNTRIYINGYLEHTTDIEMKHIITQAGGKVLSTPSSATHILTSQGLNGSKTHKLLNSKKAMYHVVRPEWLTDSRDAGKRLPERAYCIIGRNISHTLPHMWPNVVSSRPNM